MDYYNNRSESPYDQNNHQQQTDYYGRQRRVGGPSGQSSSIREGRSRSSREHDSRERYGSYRSSRRSRSRSKDHGGGGGGSSYGNQRSSERDLYKDIIDQDQNWDDYCGSSSRRSSRRRSRSRSRSKRSRSRDRDRRSRYSPAPNAYFSDGSNDSHESMPNENYYNQTPNNKIIVRGLAQHITEADINGDLIHSGLKPTSIRLIRKKKTGASRGFAFVEFGTTEEAIRWMNLKQGILMLQDQYRAVMQYSFATDGVTVPSKKRDEPTDWYCGKCGVFNFKRRENCFKCYASREESERGGEGSDEVSNILTKKIMLRNLDTLTNEEGVLCLLQDVVPSLVSKISKILVCRDPLTQTSRGICYLHFDNLVDSMNTHNALKAIDPPLKIDNREVIVSYCVDNENRMISKSERNSKNAQPPAPGTTPAPVVDTSSVPTMTMTMTPTMAPGMENYQYTLADVPRLAEYSASIYASNPAEQAYYVKYYSDYYTAQISKGQVGSLPTQAQLGETSMSANSGAAVALSAIQRKQGKGKEQHQHHQHHQQQSQYQQPPPPTPVTTMTTVFPQPPQEIPKGNDGKRYPPPNPTLYDETSGYYYDAGTGLYYDAHSQYYYNNETGAFLYWDAEKSTYVHAQHMQQKGMPEANAAPPTVEAKPEVSTVAAKGEEKKAKKEPQDKVKVAKKIVKDMEKWAKQLNQKKEMSVVALPQPMPTKSEDSNSREGYADVGFSILEKKERTTAGITNFLISQAAAGGRLVNYGSDSDDGQDHAGGHGTVVVAAADLTAPRPGNERDYVDLERLTCNLCKRAFQSPDILNKHLQMSNLHKENLAKYNLARSAGGVGGAEAGSANRAANVGGSYRDRAKERRQKYGEADSPPVNRSRERFERELERQAAAAQPNIGAAPIGQNNVGNKLLQKMGWKDGQGLGRSNQGRTEIIEASQRSSTAGLGSAGGFASGGDDYKTYIKRMMKTRYEQVDVKD